MASQYTLNNFLRLVSHPFVREYLAGRRVLGDFNWSSVTEGKTDGLAEAIEALPAKELAQIESDLVAIQDLATDAGVQLLQDEANLRAVPWLADLDGARNEHERVMVAFLRDRSLVQHIADCMSIDRFTDSRWWRRFVGKRLVVADSDEAKKRLSAQVREVFKRDGKGKRCYVESFERKAPLRLCFHAYPESLPKTDLGYDDNGQFRRQSRRTAFELVFVYKPEEGLLEMVTPGSKDQKEALASAFCKIILGLQDVPAANQKPPFDLAKLKDRNFEFKCRPEDGIARIGVRQMRLDLPGNGRRRLTVAAPPTPKEPAAVHDLLRDAVNSSNFPLADLHVGQVQITAQFKPKTRGKGKTVTFDVTYPDRCNLKDTGHDQILKQCLMRSEIARG